MTLFFFNNLSKLTICLFIVNKFTEHLVKQDGVFLKFKGEKKKVVDFFYLRKIVIAQ